MEGGGYPSHKYYQKWVPSLSRVGEDMVGISLSRVSFTSVEGRRL